jgi:hypothetical protein
MCALPVRAELEAAGVPMPTAEEKIDLSELFNDHLEIALHDSKKGKSWFQLFKQVRGEAVTGGRLH